MFTKLLIKLGLKEDPKKIIEKLLAETEVERPIEYIKVIPKKKPVKKKAPAKKKAVKKKAK